MERQLKVCSLEQAVAEVPDGARLAVGGFAVYQHPMGFLYELIRQRKKNLSLVGITSGNDVDILVGAGCLCRVETSYVGLESHGLAPNFRRAVENGTLKMVDYPEILSMDRFRASQDNFGFWPSYFLGGNDIVRLNPDIKEFSCPLSGRRVWAIPPANPDIVVIHAIMADQFGNVLVPARRLTPQSLDVTLARSCDHVIVTVEKIVDNSVLRKHPDMIEIPSYRTKSIVELPFGAHPTAMANMYKEDSDHMKAYAKAAKLPETFAEYLDSFVYGVKDHYEYLEKIGLKTLLKLRQIEVSL